MKKPLALTFLLGLLAGCATQTTRLTETTDEATGARTKTTEVKTRTFFDSKSELAKLKTSSTDKTQSVGVEGLKSESDSEGAQKIISSVIGAAVKAAVAGASPLP